MTSYPSRIWCVLALFVVAISLQAPAAGADASGAQPKLNVLFLACDDLGNLLGRTRPPGVKTPNLDRLAARGVYFERAYCQNPICNPSRASLMTGQRSDVTTVFDLERHFRTQLPDVVTLPQLFRNNGYVAARVGKIYHYNVPAGIGTAGLDDPPSWDEVVNPKGRDVADEPKIVDPIGKKIFGSSLSWLAADGEDAEQTDGMVAAAAVKLLEKHRDRPFFIAAGFYRPHTPFVAPKTYFDLYPLESIKLPPFSPDEWQRIPPAAIPHNVPKPNYGMDADTLRHATQAYYASTTFVDAQIGIVLDALDRMKLTDRTVIAFWSDHGYHLGEHGLWQKRSLFDESARAPMMVAAPASIIAPAARSAAAHACQQPVEFVDIYPTLADLAGLAPPANLAGKSLRPLLENPSATWDKPAFTQVLRPGNEAMIMGRAMTTSRWRYIEWNEGEAGRQLFDSQADPRELTNLAEKPEHQQLIRQLRAQFEAYHVAGRPPTTPIVKERL